MSEQEAQALRQSILDRFPALDVHTPCAAREYWVSIHTGELFIPINSEKEFRDLFEFAFRLVVVDEEKINPFDRNHTYSRLMKEAE